MLDGIGSLLVLLLIGVTFLREVVVRRAGERAARLDEAAVRKWWADSDSNREISASEADAFSDFAIGPSGPGIGRGGCGWIRTSAALRAPALQADGFSHSPTHPVSGAAVSKSQ